MKLRMKKFGVLCVMGVIATITAGCSQSTVEDTPETTPTQTNTSTDETNDTDRTMFPATIVDSTGQEIIIEKDPERIVSLSPSTTEILYFLGEEENIVGRTDWCNYPETINNVAAVGGTSEPNLEAILELSPDLVVASTHTSPEVIDKLREVEIPVAFLNEQESVEGTYSAIELIGELVGAQEQAELVIEDMKTRISQVTDKLANIDVLPRTYYVVGLGDSDFTAGGDTFIGELLRLAGSTNIAEDISGWSISKEVIAEGNPEIIILEENPEISLEQQISDLQAMEFYGDLTAVKEGNIHTINADIISRQAPRIVDALEDLAEIIHPEAQ